MKVLGIDPGTRFVGFALLQTTTSSGIQCLRSGTIKLGDGEVLDRLLKLQEMLTQLIVELQPDHIVFESLIYVKSPTALIKLAMAKGVMVGVVAAMYKGKIFEYKPNLVKQVVSGNGHADKMAMQKMIQLLMKKETFSSLDESDAISIALCHILLQNSGNTHQLQARVQSKPMTGKRKSGSLATSLAHKVREI